MEPEIHFKVGYIKMLQSNLFWNSSLPCGSALAYGSYDLNHRCFTYIGGRTLKSNNVTNQWDISLFKKIEETSSEPGLKAIWNHVVR